MSDDRQLGMDRSISRRDFLNGVAVGMGGTLAAGALPDALVKAAALERAIQAAVYYPPTRTGMRGSHDGSWEIAHGLRDGSFWKTAGTPVDKRDVRSHRRRRRYQRSRSGAILSRARGVGTRPDATAYTDAATDQAHRAVEELFSKKVSDERHDAR